MVLLNLLRIAKNQADKRHYDIYDVHKFIIAQQWFHIFCSTFVMSVLHFSENIKLFNTMIPLFFIFEAYLSIFIIYISFKVSYKLGFTMVGIQFILVLCFKNESI